MKILEHLEELEPLMSLIEKRLSIRYNGKEDGTQYSYMGNGTIYGNHEYYSFGQQVDYTQIPMHTLLLSDEDFIKWCSRDARFKQIKEWRECHHKRIKEEQDKAKKKLTLIENEKKKLKELAKKYPELLKTKN